MMIGRLVSSSKRCVKFSLKAAIAIIAVLAIAFAMLGRQLAHQRNLESELSARGFTWLSTPIIDIRWVPSSMLPSCIVYLVSAPILNEQDVELINNCNRAKCMSFERSDLSDWHMARLARNVHAKQVNLNGTRITDACLAHIVAVFPEVEHLDVADTDITRDENRHLLQLLHLKEVSIDGRQLESPVFDSLSKSGTLRSVTLSGKNVTTKSLERVSHCKGVTTIYLRNTSVAISQGAMTTHSGQSVINMDAGGQGVH